MRRYQGSALYAPPTGHGADGGAAGDWFDGGGGAATVAGLSTASAWSVRTTNTVACAAANAST